MLARLETVGAIEEFLEGLPDVRLDSDRSDPPTGLIFRKPDRLTVAWD